MPWPGQGPRVHEVFDESLGLHLLWHWYDRAVTEATMFQRSLPLWFVFATFSSLAAQGPGCTGTGTARLDISLNSLSLPAEARFSGPAGSPFLWFIDTAPGNLPIPGIGTACLSGMDLTLLLDSTTVGLTLPSQGQLVFNYVAPNDSGLIGVSIYSQFACLDPSVPGGIGLSAPDSIQFTLNDWQLQTPGSMVTRRGLHTATTQADGRYVLVAGGGGGVLIAPTPTATTELYDTFSQSFLPGPTMARSRVLHTSTRLLDGRILITGGLDAAATFNHDDGEIYDPATNTFTPVSNLMQAPRAAHTATLLDDGRVFIAGGNRIFAVGAGNNYIQIFSSGNDTTEIFHPATTSFSPGPQMRVGTGATLARFGHGAVKLANGDVLLAGGISGALNLIVVALPVYATQAFLYRPSTNTFLSAGNLGTGRLIPVVEQLPSGNVLVAGGAISGTLNTTNTAEIWNSVTRTFSSTPGPAQSFALAASTRLPDGSIAILGGGSGSLAMYTPSSQVVRYSEAFGFIPGNFLLTPLINHAIAPLPDGNFLLVGGVDLVGVASLLAYHWTP